MMFKNAAIFFLGHFRRGINMREATVVSICLHGVIVAAATVLLIDQPRLIGPPIKELNLELEVIAEEAPIPQQTFDSINPVESRADDQAFESGSMSSNADGGVPSANEAFLMASLNTLSAMKESFNFVTHEIVSDSVGAFLPMQSSAPDIRSLADGLNTAIAIGVRSGRIGIGGGGNCPGDGGG
jgi:hypothetical protein